jgi:hypothetical protein
MNQQLPLFSNLTWLGGPAQVVDGPLCSVVEELPQFSRIPFLMDRYENPTADLIARMPKNRHEPVVPLAMVSKNYALIQHHEVVRALCDALESFRVEPRLLASQLTLSQFGERMYLRLVLPNWVFVVSGPNDLMAMQVHCLNSVDGSTALQIRLGWYRFICSNGLYFGEEAATLRRLHTSELRIRDIAQILEGQLSRYDDERKTLLEWQKTRVSLDKVRAWVDDQVRERWGVYAAARLWHIATTGHDGAPQRVKERIKPSEYVVTNDVKVPGTPAQVQTAFDINQSLSWLAGRHDNVQGQLERAAQICTLTQSLIQTVKA